VTCGYAGMLCSTAMAAAGVIRSTQSPTPAGRAVIASRYGSTITTVTAIAPRRSTAPTARARTEATAMSAAAQR